MASAAGMEGKTAASVDEASGEGVLLLLIEQGRTREILHFKNVVRLLFPVSLPSPSPLRSPGVIVSRRMGGSRSPRPPASLAGGFHRVLEGAHLVVTLLHRGETSLDHGADLRREIVVAQRLFELRLDVILAAFDLVDHSLVVPAGDGRVEVHDTAIRRTGRGAGVPRIDAQTDAPGRLFGPPFAPFRPAIVTQRREPFALHQSEALREGEYG